MPMTQFGRSMLKRAQYIIKILVKAAPILAFTGFYYLL
jgi:hypothetical protein